MPRSWNRVTLLGHLGGDADVRTVGGVDVANFSLATARRWKDAKSGEWKEETDWHRIVFWRAGNVARYLTKGRAVLVEGRLQTRSYEDKSGDKRYVTEVVADNLILLGGGEGGGAERAGAAAPTVGAAAPSGGAYDSDDVPF